MRSRLTGLFVVVLLAAIVVSGCAAPAPATQAPAQAAPTQAPAQAAPTQAPPTAEPAKPAATAVPPTAVPPTEAPAAAAPATAAPAAAAPAPEYIEIGASIPLTGKFGSLGTQVKPGYAYAIDDINKSGGVYVKEYDKKIPLRLTAYDDESDPTKAIAKLETVFADNNVVAYLGGAGSDMHAATTAIAEKNKVPYCGVSFALWAIHQKGYKYLFSPFPKSPNQAKDVYEYLNAMLPEGQRPTKVAIFQEKTDWGKELGGLWKENAPKYGYEIVDYEEYAPGTKDYSGMILKAKAAGAESLFGMPTQPDGVAMFKQMVELGWTPKFSLIIRAPRTSSGRRRWARTATTSPSSPAGSIRRSTPASKI